MELRWRFICNIKIRKGNVESLGSHCSGQLKSIYTATVTLSLGMQRTLYHQSKFHELCRTLVFHPSPLHSVQTKKKVSCKILKFIKYAVLGLLAIRSRLNDCLGLGFKNGEISVSGMTPASHLSFRRPRK